MTQGGIDRIKLNDPDDLAKDIQGQKDSDQRYGQLGQVQAIRDDRQRSNQFGQTGITVKDADNLTKDKKKKRKKEDNTRRRRQLD